MKAQAPIFTMRIAPGDATAEDIAALYQSLNDLYRFNGGSGHLKFNLAEPQAPAPGDLDAIAAALAIADRETDAFNAAKAALARLRAQAQATAPARLARPVRMVAAALYAQARSNGRLYWQYRRSGDAHPWPLIAKERRLAYWNAAGIARVVGAPAEPEVGESQSNQGEKA